MLIPSCRFLGRSFVQAKTNCLPLDEILDIKSGRGAGGGGEEGDYVSCPVKTTAKKRKVGVTDAYAKSHHPGRS